MLETVVTVVFSSFGDGCRLYSLWLTWACLPNSLVSSMLTQPGSSRIGISSSVLQLACGVA